MITFSNLSVKQFKALFNIHFTENMTGKMEGMQSLSTSCTVNPHCLERIKNNDLICAHCFAFAHFDIYKNNLPCFEKNAENLTAEIIPVDYWPILNCFWFRFESFGDLINTTQCINYFNLCLKNPRVNFALWTKNPWIIDEAINAGHKKPDNLIIVYSSPVLNKSVGAEIIKKWSFIDKIFTVYDEDHVASVDINCGSKKCIECGLCYEKNETMFINEKLK